MRWRTARSGSLCWVAWSGRDRGGEEHRREPPPAAEGTGSAKVSAKRRVDWPVELRNAGAEAIAINDQRLNVLGGIRNTNRAIHVNGRPVNAPYVVSVIGDPRTLQARLLQTSQGQEWFALVNGLGFVYTPENVDDIRLPAAPDRILRDVIELNADPDGGPDGEGSSP